MEGGKRMHQSLATVCRCGQSHRVTQVQSWPLLQTETFLALHCWHTKHGIETTHNSMQSPPNSAIQPSQGQFPNLVQADFGLAYIEQWKTCFQFCTQSNYFGHGDKSGHLSMREYEYCAVHVMACLQAAGCVVCQTIGQTSLFSFAQK